MAVIISNMDMPKGCLECRYHDDEVGFCRLTASYTNACFSATDKNPKCPLKSTDEMMEEIRGLETISQEEIDGENPYISGSVEYVPLNEVMEIINEYI